LYTLVCTCTHTHTHTHTHAHGHTHNGRKTGIYAVVSFSISQTTHLHTLVCTCTRTHTRTRTFTNPSSPISAMLVIFFRVLTSWIGDRFEELCKEEQATLTAMLQDVLSQASLTTADIAAVELAGGTSRVPWVKKTVSTLFGDESLLSTMLDRCGFLPPSFASCCCCCVDQLPHNVRFFPIYSPRPTLVALPALLSARLSSGRQRSWSPRCLRASR
jgi:hypothetical protein